MVDKFNVEYIPGGATQNSMRVAQVSKCNIISLLCQGRQTKNEKKKENELKECDNATITGTIAISKGKVIVCGIIKAFQLQYSAVYHFWLVAAVAVAVSCFFLPFPYHLYY